MTEKKSKTPGTVELVLVLFLISAVTALLLGFVNFITEDRIAQIKAGDTSEAMTEVMPGDYKFVSLEGDWDSELVSSVYSAESGGTVQGYVVQISVSGFAGAIEMAVGVTTDAEVTGVALISHTETSGLGAEAEKESFRSQYVGATDTVDLSKNGGTIDAITGATITSEAVTSGVNAAIETVKSLN